MAYCDYEFYTKEYLGNVIAAVDFPRLSSRASDKLDMLTFDRIKNSFLDEEVETKVKKATCKLAELYSDIELKDKVYRDNGGMPVSSVSSGSESISYATNGSTNATDDRKAQEVMFYESAREYLTGTGLLYAGL